MAARVAEADEHGEVLRYVGSYDAESGVCQVGVRRCLPLFFVCTVSVCAQKFAIRILAACKSASATVETPCCARCASEGQLTQVPEACPC